MAEQQGESSVPEKTLEEIFEELETIAERLEERDISLEESFELYRSGMQKIQLCNDKIDTVEKKMLTIDEDGELHEF